MSMSPSGPRRRRGFTLIEVLVSLLVLAIGLLGLAALQTQGVRFNHDAAVRTQATNLAYDMLERLRIERLRIEGLERQDPAAHTYPDDLVRFTTANFPDAPWIMPECAPTSTAASDQLFCWLAEVSEALPAGRASIEQQAADLGAIDITLSWLDREPRSFAGQTRLPRTEAECEARSMRRWSDPNCMVIQTWTVRP